MYPESLYEATAGLSITVIDAGHILFMVSPKVTETIKKSLSDKKY